MKKSLVLVLAFAISAAAFATGSKETPATSSGVQLNPLGQLPLVNQPVSLNVFAQLPAYIKDWSTNDFTLWLEKKTNVHLNWDMVPTASLNDKRSLVLASGDYPDFFLYAAMTPEEEVTYGSHGVLIPLNSLIQKDAPNLQKVFQMRPYLKGALTTPDGNIYSLARINECYHCSLAMRAYINKDWLDKLGLKMPTTTDEFEQVLKAFKTGDPNGNGKADEIPLMGSLPGWNTNVYDFFINSFIYNQGQDNGRGTERVYLQDGKVVANFDKPQFRDALKWLNKLYGEGLIAPESFTQDNLQFYHLATQPGVPLIGAGTASTWWQVSGLDDMKNADGKIRNRSYVALPPLKGPAGVRWAALFPFFQETQLQITSKAKYPDLIVRWADLFYTPEITIYASAGPNEGVDWRRGQSGEVGINGKPASFVQITQPSSVFNNSWSNMGTMFQSNDMRLGLKADPSDPWAQELRLYTLSKEAYAPYAPDPGMVFPPVYVLPSEVGEFSRLKTTIDDYVRESIVRFITGDLKIDTDWNQYLGQLNTIGAARYLQLLQQAYDRQYK